MLLQNSPFRELDALFNQRPATRSALRMFQLSEGLVGDGFPDHQTLALLGIGNF